MSKTKRKPFKPTYTLWNERFADPARPMPIHLRTHQLTRMWQGLADIETSANPTTESWRLCSDAVNLLETLVTEGVTNAHGQRHFEPKEGDKPQAGWWFGCDREPVQVIDTSGSLEDAVHALAYAGKRLFSHGVIRLDGPGCKAVRTALENYADLLEQLPAKTIVRVHRMTEFRIHDLLTGKKRPNDVEIMSL